MTDHETTLRAGEASVRDWRKKAPRRWWMDRRLWPVHGSNLVVLIASIIVGLATGFWLAALVIGGLFAFCGLGLLCLGIARRML